MLFFGIGFTCLTVNNPSSFQAGGSENQVQVRSPMDNDEDRMMDISPPDYQSTTGDFNVGTSISSALKPAAFNIGASPPPLLNRFGRSIKKIPQRDHKGKGKDKGKGKGKGKGKVSTSIKQNPIVN